MPRKFLLTHSDSDISVTVSASKQTSFVRSFPTRFGRWLLRTWKSGTKVILSAVMLLAALGSSRSAKAEFVKVTIKGTVASGLDDTGVFKFPPGTSLAGQSFRLVLIFDSSKGVSTFSTSNSTINGSSASSPGSGKLYIGKGSWNFGMPAGTSAHTSSILLEAGAPTNAGQAGQLSYSITDATSGSLSTTLLATIDPASGTVLTADGNLLDPLSNSDISTTASTSAFSIETLAGGKLTNYAEGHLTVTSINTSGGLATNPDAKGLGDCGCNGSPDSSNFGDPGASDPITVGNGNLFEQVTDYSTTGVNRLAFVRYYNSLGNETGMNSYVSEMGINWRTNYDAVLHLGSGVIIAERPNGQQITFTQKGSVWTPDSDVDVKLTQSGTTYTLTDHEDTVETYDTVSGAFYDLTVSYGQLESIKLRNGYTRTISRTANEIAVTDSYDRVLKLALSNGLIDTLTTPDSLVLTYAYTALAGGNRLTSVSYSTKPVTDQTYLYENAAFPYALTGITDENGKRFATWTYDANGLAISSQHGTGASTADLTNFTYNVDGTTTVTNALGVADTYIFTTLQNMPKVTEIDRAATSTTKAAKETFTYDTYGYLNGKTDWNTNKTTYVNKSHGQPTTIDEAVGSSVARTTTISYDATWVHEPHQLVTPGLTSTFTYDSNGNALTRTDLDTTTTTLPYSTKGQSRVTTWTWSSTGQETSIRLPRTDVSAKTTFTYDGTGALTQTDDALGHLTKVTAHTGGGLPETIVDANNVTTTLTYDARLNLNMSTLTTKAGKLVTTWIHDAANNLTALELPDNSKLTYSYDGAHRLIGTKDLFGNSIDYTLDALGDRTLVQTANGSNAVTRKHSAKFDALGRLSQDIGGMGQTTVYTYDTNGNALTLTPPSPSGEITYTYDALNRRSIKKDPLPGGTITTAYDAHNRVLSVEDANSHTTSYVYDGFGDRIQTGSPDSGITTFHYDADANLTQSVKPGPQAANITYDALDRPLITTYPADGTLKVSRSYDQTGHGFGIGHLTSVTDQPGSLSLTYDERGNITAENRAVSSAGSLVTNTVYDAASRVSGIAYSSGTLMVYGRDTMGRVTSVTAQLPGAKSISNVATNITYEPFGDETGLTYGNGIKGSYGYDLDYRPTTRSETGTMPVQKLTYGYYPNDSVEMITDGVNAANTQTLGYDAFDRLISAKSGSGGYGTESFSWDPVGNIKTKLDGGITTTFSYATGSNRLTQALDTGGMTEIVSNTPAGNLSGLTIGGAAMENAVYDQANELGAVQTTGSAATYKYDSGGQRIEKAMPGEHPVLYGYGITDGALLSENDLNRGQTADYIYLNGRPIAEVNPTSGFLYFTHTDRLGTPQKLTASTQAVAWNALYQPFGGATFSGTLATQSLRLPGQYFDPETGLYHNGFRDYAPGLTRYVETDPIGLRGGMDTFQYVDGNPLSLVDRQGLDVTSSVLSNPVLRYVGDHPDYGYYIIAGSIALPGVVDLAAAGADALGEFLLSKDAEPLFRYGLATCTASKINSVISDPYLSQISSAGISFLLGQPYTMFNAIDTIYQLTTQDPQQLR